MDNTDPNSNIQENQEYQNSQNQDSQNETNNNTFSEMKDLPLPEPTLLTLATQLATQAMVSMGIFPNPITGQTMFLMNQAKHLIDTVALLDEKTKGNQTEQESATFENMLHELHMLYVAAEKEKNRRENEEIKK